MSSAGAAVTDRRTRELLEQMDREFWAWVDFRLSEPDTAGMTEQQFLDTIKRPGWKGRKARGPKCVL